MKFILVISILLIILLIHSLTGDILLAALAGAVSLIFADNYGEKIIKVAAGVDEHCRICGIDDVPSRLCGRCNDLVDRYAQAVHEYMANKGNAKEESQNSMNELEQIIKNMVGAEGLFNIRKFINYEQISAR